MIPYFAYGSNLMKERITLMNKSAIKFGVGKLKDYKVHFVGNSKHWHGAYACLEDDKGGEVWGIIWHLDENDIANLDRQEFNYSARTVDIEMEDGNIIPCRTYVCNSCGDDLGPGMGKPSVSYKSVIIKGAKDNGIPQYYIDWLESIEDNKNSDPPRIEGLKWPLE